MKRQTPRICSDRKSCQMTQKRTFFSSAVQSCSVTSRTPTSTHRFGAMRVNFKGFKMSLPYIPSLPQLHWLLTVARLSPPDLLKAWGIKPIGMRPTPSMDPSISTHLMMLRSLPSTRSSPTFLCSRFPSISTCYARCSKVPCALR